MVALAVLLGAAGAGASKIFFLPLSEVVRADTVVFAATVTSVHQRSDDQHWYVDYELSAMRAINGAVPPGISKATYSQVIPVIRDASGKVIGGFSPKLSASGQEGQVTAGTTWLFLTARIPDGGDAAIVVRVEPEEMEEQVRELIVAAGGEPHPQASAAEPAAESEPASPPPAPSAPPVDSAAGAAPPASAVAAPGPPAQPATTGCGSCAIAGNRSRLDGACWAALAALLVARRRGSCRPRQPRAGRARPSAPRA